MKVSRPVLKTSRLYKRIIIILEMSLLSLTHLRNYDAGLYTSLEVKLVETPATSPSTLTTFRLYTSLEVKLVETLLSTNRAGTSGTPVILYTSLEVKLVETVTPYRSQRANKKKTLHFS